MLQGRCKAAAHHVAQHVKNHDIGVFEQMVFFEQLHGLPDHITAAAGTRRWTTSFDAHNAVVAFKYKVFYAQLFGMKVHGLQHIDHRR